MTKNKNDVQTSIRIPKELHTELREAAFKKRISLNQELLHRITHYKEEKKQ